MPILKNSEVKGTQIGEGISRKLAWLDNIMAAAIEFTDGPMEEPIPPHSHPHEQIAYVAEGELIFFIGDEQHQLEAGDLYLVPSNVPHTIQTLTKYVKLIDFFNPIREDFLK